MLVVNGVCKVRLVMLALVAFFIADGGNSAHAERVQVAVAANFKSTLDQLETEFERQTGHDLQASSGSTGKLYAQIRQGAPFDVFLAADQLRPALLEEEGVGVSSMRTTYAVGRLALWDPKGGEIGPDVLFERDFNRLAIANPDLAPYGAAARDVIDGLSATENLARRMVYGENIGQAFAFVATGNAEIGFVALSQLRSLPPQRQGAYWLAPSSMHEPIRQDAVLLISGEENIAATSFMTFLKSETARRIIEQAGYDLP